MGTLYRYEIKKLLCQKILWIAVALMTLILVGVGITDVVTGRAAISKNYKEFSGREIDDSLIKEVQEAEDQEHYIVFRSFINFCMENRLRFGFSNASRRKKYDGKICILCTEMTNT